MKCKRGQKRFLKIIFYQMKCNFDEFPASGSVQFGILATSIAETLKIKDHRIQRK